jgi:hypothetical protein
MKITWQKKTMLGHIISSFLWMAPSLVLIYLVAAGKINYMVAIVIVVLFHFLAMYILIKHMHYKKK